MPDRMTERVACRRCGAHRDLARSPRCLVCGSEPFDRVQPTPGDLTVSDLPGIDRELVEIAEAIDYWIQCCGRILMNDGSPLTVALRDACRRRALALALAGRSA